MMKHTRPTWMIGLALAAALALTGCEGDDPADSAGTSADSDSGSDTSDGSADTDADGDEEADGDDEGLPADFPDIPLYEPHRVATVNSMSGQYVVGFSTGADKEDVIAFFEGAYSSDGWEIDDTGRTDSRFAASNGSVRVVIGVTAAGNSSVFTVTAPQQ